MIRITNELLFYGGLIVAAASLLAFIIFLLISKLMNVSLEAKFKEEYGGAYRKR